MSRSSVRPDPYTGSKTSTYTSFPKYYSNNSSSSSNSSSNSYPSNGNSSSASQGSYAPANNNSVNTEPATNNSTSSAPSNSFTDGLGRTFTRNSDGSLSLTKGGTTVNYGVGSRDHNQARAALGQAGGNWNTMGANPQTPSSQPTVSKPYVNPSGGVIGNSAYNQFEKSFDEMNKTGQWSAGWSTNVRPTPTAPEGAGAEWYLNQGANYAGQAASNVMDNQLYWAQKESADANRLATENAVRQIEGNRDGINQRADELAREAFINSLRSGRQLDETMAVSGINGGAAESSRLGLETSYGEIVAKVGQERTNALNDLENAIATTRANGEIQTAEIMSRYHEKIAEAAIQGQRDGFDRMMAAMQYDLQRTQYEQSYGLQMLNYNNALEERDFARMIAERDYGDSRQDIKWNQDMQMKQYNMDLEMHNAELMKLNQAMARAKAYTSSRLAGSGSSGSSGSSGYEYLDENRNVSPTPSIKGASLERPFVIPGYSNALRTSNGDYYYGENNPYPTVNGDFRTAGAGLINSPAERERLRILGLI